MKVKRSRGKTEENEWQLITGVHQGCIVAGGAGLVLLSPFIQTLLDSISVVALAAIVSTVLAILIPLAIAMLKDTRSVLDTRIMLRKVFDTPLLSAATIVLILPAFLLWDFSLEKPHLRSTILVFFTIAIWSFIRSIIRVYRWLIDFDDIKDGNYKNKQRLDYLTNIPDQEKPATWSLIWQDVDNHKPIDGDKLVPMFIDHIDKFPVDKRIHLMTPIQQFTDQLGAINLSHPVVYSCLFNFTTKTVFGPTETNQPETQHNYQFLIKDLFNQIIGRSLREFPPFYLLLGNIKKFDFKDGNIDKTKFAQALTGLFFQQTDLIKNLNPAPSVWDDIPKGWKITSDNLLGKDKEFSLSWLRQYKRWMINRIQQHFIEGAQSKSKQPNTDILAHKITTCLLPTIDYIRWYTLLEVQYMPRDIIYPHQTGKPMIEDAIRASIQTPSRLVFCNQPIAYQVGAISEDVLLSKDQQKQVEIFKINKNIKYELFPMLSDPNVIDDYLSVARKMSYKDQSKEEMKRQRIIKTLEVAKRWSLEQTTK